VYFIVLILHDIVFRVVLVKFLAKTNKIDITVELRFRGEGYLK